MPLFLPGDFSIPVEITPRFACMHRFPSNFLPEKQGSHGVLLPSCKILFFLKKKKNAKLG